MMTNPRGATLMEMMISLAITSVVMVALLGTTSTHFNFANRGTARAQLSVDMMFLSDYFSKEIPSAGGELLPVWSGIMSENNCGARANFPNCNGTDRMTIVNPVGTAACSVRGSAPGTILIDNGGGTCCLDTMNLIGTHILLVRIASVGDRYVTGVDRVNCSITVVNGPLVFNDTVTDTVTEPYDWTGAILFPVDIRTFYLDQTTNELVRFTYTNNSNGRDEGVASPLADRVLDFQVAFGYDFDPVDGVIRDTGDATDEWLNNAPGAVEQLGQGQFRYVSRSQLRMVALGMVLGQPDETPNSSGGFRLLDGPPLTPGKWLIESQVSNFMIRSTRAYQ